jgi:folylpolyglutamate synthase
MEAYISCGIEQFSWPGRYQQINERNSQWFLHGAHDELSLRYAVEWFAETTTTENRKHVIISDPQHAPSVLTSCSNVVAPTRILISIFNPKWHGSSA